MDPLAALICNLIILVGMVLWYRNVLRIYNKFKIHYGEGTPWDEDKDDDTFQIVDNEDKAVFNALNDSRTINDKLVSGQQGGGLDGPSEDDLRKKAMKVQYEC